MSPSIDDRFDGHFSKGDPRGPLSAAGGCVWPTIPAYRYWLLSDDATLDLAFFNTNPVIIQQSTAQPAHNAMLYTLLGTHPYVTAAFAMKAYTPLAPRYSWSFLINVIAIPEDSLNWSRSRDRERCNRDVPLPNVWAFDIDRGVTGDTFRMEQIEWNKLQPPG